jgi:TM2 domain-containing membrane protein YozV
MNQALAVKNDTTHPVIPAVLSMMLPGLGQLVNAQLVKALFVFFLSPLIIPYLFGIIDAYFTAKNRRDRVYLLPVPATRGLLMAPAAHHEPPPPRPNVATKPAPPTRHTSSTAAQLTLEQLLLHHARRQGGEISVTEGVMATGRSFEEVEKTLDGMCKSGYVEIDNRADSGVVVYRFDQLAV